MIKQSVVRTYPKSFSRTTERLTEYLEAGYVVKHITPLEDSITEYIVEKEIEVKK